MHLWGRTTDPTYVAATAYLNGVAVRLGLTNGSTAANLLTKVGKSISGMGVGQNEFIVYSCCSPHYIATLPSEMHSVSISADRIKALLPGLIGDFLLCQNISLCCVGLLSVGNKIKLCWFYSTSLMQKGQVQH